MTGLEHYREAEKLLVNIGNAEAGHPFAALWVEMAEIHATLALAAAALDSSHAGRTPGPATPPHLP